MGSALTSLHTDTTWPSPTQSKPRLVTFPTLHLWTRMLCLRSSSSSTTSPAPSSPRSSTWSTRSRRTKSRSTPLSLRSTTCTASSSSPPSRRSATSSRWAERRPKHATQLQRIPSAIDVLACSLLFSFLEFVLLNRCQPVSDRLVGCASICFNLFFFLSINFYFFLFIQKNI